METIKPNILKDGEEIAKAIEARSIATLVEPYRKLSALTSTEILELLNDPGKVMEKRPEWLERWEAKYSGLREVG